MAPASFGTTVIYEQKTLLSFDEKARGQHCKKDDHMYHHYWSRWMNTKYFRKQSTKSFIFIWPPRQYNRSRLPCKSFFPSHSTVLSQIRHEIRKTVISQHRQPAIHQTQ